MESAIFFVLKFWGVTTTRHSPTSGGASQFELSNYSLPDPTTALADLDGRSARSGHRRPRLPEEDLHHSQDYGAVTSASGRNLHGQSLKAPMTRRIVCTRWRPQPSYRRRRGRKAAKEEKEGGVPERRLPMEEIAGGGGEVVVPPSPTRSREIAAPSPHRLGPSFCGPIQRFTRTVTYRSGHSRISTIWR